MKLRTLTYLPIFCVLTLSSCSGSGTTEDGVENEAETLYPEGKKVYDKSCIACHQEDGNGIPGSFPPLAKSDYMLEDVDRAIEQVLCGSQGEMVVNGEVYNNIMPPQNLSDTEVRDVMNYVLNSWGNDGGEVSLKDVTSAKHPD
ncbi:MAG: cytochrome c [Flavobacteriales bacterium]|jgi:nitrite reductase (NO-forming)|nr:cytochrome c [Flavobacteriales bacterium]